VAQGLGLKVKNGLIVASVDEMSPAKEIGITQGDVLIKVGDEEIAKQSDWEEIVTYARVGEPLKMAFVRGDDTLNVSLKPEELPIRKAPSYTDRFGITVAAITKQLVSMYGLNDDRGVLIANWAENGIASSWDLQKGDIIRGINRQKVSNLSDYKKIVEKISPGYKVLFIIERSGELYYLAVMA